MSSRAVVAHRSARGEFVARGSVTSAITTTLAAISHTVGGGQAPSPTIVVGMIVLLIAPSALLLTVRSPRAVVGRLLGRPDRSGARVTSPGLIRIVAATAFAQLAFHGVFSLLGAPSGAVSGAAHAHHGHGYLAAMPISHAGSEDPGMVSAHAVAAVFTVAILAYGESILRRGAAWVRRTARTFAPVRSLPEIPRDISYAAPRILISSVWLPATGVRGPPVCS
ncbi:MAG TPA: hypothetical protein H9800_08005 [Candidatus Microbacterium stercoravium]|uniref:Uncharacterized protein n=1 Tax=Candidatus Microbacterium stercoravium TaxID=2838697 RepID=A0A9D2H764_9MICO|nr:hypothetical protein [Candidatus Microbacterium stercoravium]